MIAVVDASVAVKWFLHSRPDEDHADQRYYDKAKAEGQITLLADFRIA